MQCLIVDDEAPVRGVLRRLLRAEGFECSEAESGEEALVQMTGNPASLILTDYKMSGIDGAELLRRVRTNWPDTGVVMVTAADDIGLAVKCLEAGALDYLTKPFDTGEVRARIAQVMEKRRLIIENREYREHLEERVAAQAQAHEQLFLASLQSLTDALEVKDAYTWGHSARMSSYAIAIGRELSLSDDLLKQLELGSRLHDLGKIGVRESVLNKEGPLTDEEYNHVMQHPVIGWRLLAPLLSGMPQALAVVRSHHERVDGKGVPDALKGDDIPLVARIAAVADAFDAMTSGRPYRDGMRVADALAELRRCAGMQFDNECVTAFERAISFGTIRLPDWSVRARTHLRIVS